MSIVTPPTKMSMILNGLGSRLGTWVVRLEAYYSIET